MNKGYELVEIDAAGNEDLLATGSFDRMSESMSEAFGLAEEDGYDLPMLRVQPVA